MARVSVSSFFCSAIGFFIFFFGFDWQTTTWLPSPTWALRSKSNSVSSSGHRAAYLGGYIVLWGYIVIGQMGHHAFAVNACKALLPSFLIGIASEDHNHLISQRCFAFAK
jgi:hypothetical protein